MQDTREAIVPTEIELEPRRPISAPIANNIPPVAIIALNTVKRVSWRTWLVGGSFTAAMVVYMGQWQKPVAPVAQENPFDSRNIPAYSEVPLMEQGLRQLSEHDLNMAALLNDERQRTTVAIAQSFTALAVTFGQTPGHKCQGLTVLDCLQTFDANRMAELNQLATGTSTSKTITSTNLLAPILEKSMAQQKVAGLWLAKIMAKPPQSRRPSEQQVIDQFYPVLNSGLPVEQLQPRPATLSKNILYGETLENEVLAQSPEKQNKVEFCLSLTEEQRTQTKGCQ